MTTYYEVLRPVSHADLDTHPAYARVLRIIPPRGRITFGLFRNIDRSHASKGIARACSCGILKKVSPHERVLKLDFVRFWCTQFNRPGHKNTVPGSSTRDLYLGAFTKFDEWLPGHSFPSYKTAVKVLKVELKDTRDYMRSISPKDQTRPTQVDVEFVVADVIRNQAFLVENGLFGENDDGGMTHGILKAIQTIRQLNVQIAAYNSASDSDLKSMIRDRLYTPHNVLSGNLDDAPSIIEGVISICQSTIDKYE